jgi:hypothetical protein
MVTPSPQSSLLICIAALFIYQGAIGFAEPPLCGVTLRPAAEEVRQHVEKLYKKEVSCITAPDLYHTEGSRARSDDKNGTPVITVDFFTGRNETTITHELFHLQLYRSGFPVNMEIPKPPNRSQAAGHKVVSDLISYMQHRIFFPKMIAIGLDPYAQNEEEMRSNMARNAPPPMAKEAPEMLAILFLPELDRSLALRKPYLDWYKKMGWSNQIALAGQLHQVITKDNPTTSVAAENTLQKCLILIYP